MPDFPKIASLPPLSDQDFLAVHQILSSIEKDDNKLKQLETLFPDYKTFTGQSFEQDYKRLQSEWRNENDNDATVKFAKIILNKQGLMEFCQWIKSIVENNPAEIERKNIQLILSVAHHAVTLQYDATTKKWYIADSLNLDDENLKTGLDDKEMLDNLFKYLTYDSNLHIDSRFVKFSSELIVDKRINPQSISLDEFKKITRMLHVSVKNETKTFYFSSLRELNIISSRFNKYADELITATFSSENKYKQFTNTTLNDFYNFISENPTKAKLLIDSLLTTPDSCQKFITSIYHVIKIFTLYPEFILQHPAAVESPAKSLADASNYQIYIQSARDGFKLIQIFPEYKNKIMDYLIQTFPNKLFDTVDDLMDLIKKFPDYERKFMELLMSPGKFIEIIGSYHSFMRIISSMPAHYSQLMDLVLSSESIFDSIFLSDVNHKSNESRENTSEYETQIVNTLLSSRRAIGWISLIEFIETIPSCDKQLMNFVMSSQENFNLIFFYCFDFAHFIQTYPAHGSQLVERMLSSQLCFDKIFKSGADLGYFILRCPAYKKQLMDYLLSDLDRLILKLSNECSSSILGLIFAASNDFSDDKFSNLIKKLASISDKFDINDVMVSLNHLQLQRKILAYPKFDLSFSLVSTSLPGPSFSFLEEMNNIRIDTDASDMKLQKLLNHIARGEQDHAEIMLQNNPDLLFKKGSVTDYSDRIFNNITPFQLSLWNLDKHMWNMILKYLPIEEAHAQYVEHKYAKTTYKNINSDHYDFMPLIYTYQSYIDNNSFSSDIGKAQRMMPVHVVNEFCFPGRLFVPIPQFDEAVLPRQLTCTNFNIQDNWLKPDFFKFFGLNFVICKGESLQPFAYDTAPRDNVQKDMEALKALSQVRYREYLELENKLDLSQSMSRKKQKLF